MPLLSAVRKALPQVEREHRVRAHLQEGLIPVVDRREDGAREQDRISQVLPPVRCVEPLARDRRAGDGAVHRQHSAIGRNAVEGLLELSLKGRHLRAMERVIDLELAAAHAALLEPLQHREERLRFPGEHHRSRVVDGRDREPPLVTGDLRGHRFGGELYRSHLARPGGSLHQPPSEADDTRALFQAERPGDMRRRQLSDAVADHGVRDDPPRLPERRQTYLEREDRRLRDLGLAEARLALRRS